MREVSNTQYYSISLKYTITGITDRQQSYGFSKRTITRSMGCDHSCHNQERAVVKRSFVC